MTTAPAHPPVFAADDVNLNEIIDTPLGPSPRWLAATILRGQIGAAEARLAQVHAEFEQIRNDSVILQTRAEELRSLEQALKDKLVKVIDAIQRTDSLVNRCDAYEERQRIYQEREQEEPLSLPPGHEPEPAQELEGDSSAPGELSDKPENPDLRTPTIPPVLDAALVDTLQPLNSQPRTPVAAGLDRR